MKSKQFVLTLILVVTVLVAGIPMVYAAPEAPGNGGDASAGSSEPSKFASQAEAIEYYVAKAQSDPQEEKVDAFSSQAEAIDYYMAKSGRNRGDEAGVSFASQAEAIDHYVALNQCEREDPVSFSSQAGAIDYYVAKAQSAQDALARSTLDCVAVN